MGRRKQAWTKAKFERYIKEGRGDGRGKNYKPWIIIQDFSSKGRSSRSPGWKSDRIHHFMSNLELSLFYLFEWSDSVIDIREQYPLLNLDLAVSIADELGINYPKDGESGTSRILTTDFMLTVKEGEKLVQIARTVKLAKDLEDKRVIEKLQLEKCYWNRQGIDWAIVTEKEIPKVFVNNIKWVHSAYQWKIAEEIDNENCYCLDNILKERLTTKKTRINTITTALDRDMGFESGTSLSLFKHLIARKEVIINMQEKKISSSCSADIIKEVI